MQGREEIMETLSLKIYNKLKSTVPRTVKRHDSILKQTLERITYGSRGRGKPKTIWMDNVMQQTA